MIPDTYDDILKKILILKELVYKNEFKEDRFKRWEGAINRDLAHISKSLDININWMNENIKLEKEFYE
jgi:hypothetical protein